MPLMRWLAQKRVPPPLVLFLKMFTVWPILSTIFTLHLIFAGAISPDQSEEEMIRLLADDEGNLWYTAQFVNRNSNLFRPMYQTIGSIPLALSDLIRKGNKRYGPAGRIILDPLMGRMLLAKWQQMGRLGRERHTEQPPASFPYKVSKRYACRFKFCRIFSHSLS